MERTNFEKLRVYLLSERLADELWKTVIGWSYVERDTVGRQLVRAGDSIGANIAEGAGRGTFLDNLTAEQTARIKPMIDELAPMLNAYLKSIGPPVKI